LAFKVQELEEKVTMLEMRNKEIESEKDLYFTKLS